MSISAADVKKLRDNTGAGMMEELRTPEDPSSASHTGYENGNHAAGLVRRNDDHIGAAAEHRPRFDKAHRFFPHSSLHYPHCQILISQDSESSDIVPKSSNGAG